jgi:hypothetical protein
MDCCHIFVVGVLGKESGFVFEIPSVEATYNSGMYVTRIFPQLCISQRNRDRSQCDVTQTLHARETSSPLCHITSSSLPRPLRRCSDATRHPSDPMSEEKARVKRKQDYCMMAALLRRKTRPCVHSRHSALGQCDCGGKAHPCSVAGQWKTLRTSDHNKNSGRPHASHALSRQGSSHHCAGRARQCADSG